MDSLSSWKNAGSGFDLSNVSTNRLPRSSSSITSTSQRPSRKSSKSTQSRPTKQALLFSRDKTPLITPRESKPSTSRSTTQSKLSASSFGRKPLQEKTSNRSTLQSTRKGGGGSIKKLQSLELVDPDVDLGDGNQTNSNSSNSSNGESAQVSKSLLASSSSTSRWKGKLSTRQISGTSSTSSNSVARQILNPTNRKKGPTIEFDRDDLGSGSEDEMRGETQRRKRRKRDLGGWGKLDLMSAEDAEEREDEEEEEEETRDRSVDTSKERRRNDSVDLEEHGRPQPTNKNRAFLLGPLPPPRQTSHSRSQYRETSTQSSGSVASAEDIQALLVPFKPPPRVLVPDSDELTPPSQNDYEGMEEPDTEADDEEECAVGNSTPRQVLQQKQKQENGRQERSDDSGFVEMIDLCDSSSPPRPLAKDRDLEDEEDDDLASIPDSQPSVASHLSHALGSSPPRSRSSSVMILDPPPAPSRRRVPLQPTESAILMPPPAVAPPRKRLRRGPPPRKQPSPTTSSPRVLVEDTQYSHSIDSPSSHSHSSRPFRIFCEETQYPEEGIVDANEQLRRWNELNTRLPSDLPSLDSDQIHLPSPKPLRPLRPSKELPQPQIVPLEHYQFPLPSNRARQEEHVQMDNRENVGGEEAKGEPVVMNGEWESLNEAWKGSKPLSPPPPPQPRQSRLGEFFNLTGNDGTGEEIVVEDSQAPVKSLEFEALERAVRDSIHGLGGGTRKAIKESETMEKLEAVEEEKEEEDSVCSSPLSSLSPSLSPPARPSPSAQLQPNSHVKDDDEVMEAEEEENEDSSVIPDSDPEDDLSGITIFSSRKSRRSMPISPLGGKQIHSRFPKYELPKSVLEFGNETSDEGKKAGEDVAQGEAGMEESMWESYWTVGSPDDEQEEEVGEGDTTVGASKTVAELLFEQVPQLNLPAGWYENEDGELVRKEIDLDGEEGEL